MVKLPMECAECKKGPLEDNKADGWYGGEQFFCSECWGKW
jgi:hypothetical protein